jgi:hypothetical protein
MRGFQAPLESDAGRTKTNNFLKNHRAMGEM